MQEPVAMKNAMSARRKETTRAFEQFYNRPLYTLADSEAVPLDQKLALTAVLRRPELRPLLKNVLIHLRDIGQQPFILCSNHNIVINREILSEPASAAFHFYHSLELRSLQIHHDGGRAGSNFLLAAVAALYSSLGYYEQLTEAEQQSASPVLEPWLCALIELNRKEAGHPVGDRAVIQAIAARHDRLLPLQERSASNRHAISHKHVDEVVSQAVMLLPLLDPTAQILTKGGDNRLALCQHTGLNSYGCSPRPRPWAITFSSCTASSISDFAFQCADWLRQDLLAHARHGEQYERSSAEYRRIRAELRELLELGEIPDTDILLASSGTDAELYALFVAMERMGTPLRNILISTTEIGSGTVHAAGGRHFDESTPLGGSVQKGSAIEGFPVENIEVSIVELRDERGLLRSQEELNGAVKQLVDEALQQNVKVLLHLLDCSKTGMSGPGFDQVRALKHANPESVEVVVDAAQMRLTNHSLHRFLKEDFMVILSASKFYTGPPFAGALIVPSGMTGRLQQSAKLPSGLRDYSTPQELPESWQDMASALHPNINYWLMLRWRAALWEMRAFHSVSNEDREKTISRFGSQVIDMIDRNPDIELVPVPPPQREYPDDKPHWDRLQSIFTFLVFRPDGDGRKPLNYAEARLVYQLINMDAMHLLPVQASDREYELMRKRCHIGQPVRLPGHGVEPTGALRIAAGARLVSGVEFDDALGLTPEERLDTEIRTASVILSKLSVIMKYWDDFKGYELPEALKRQPVQYQF